MQKITTQSEWISRAQAVLPAGGFGNFDSGIMIARGDGSRVWDEDGFYLRKNLNYKFNSLIK